MTDLGTLSGGSTSGATGINASGQIVGYSDTSGQYLHAFLYSSGTMTDLGTLSGGFEQYGIGINASGQVVGLPITSSSTNHAFLYTAVER